MLNDDDDDEHERGGGPPDGLVSFTRGRTLGYRMFFKLSFPCFTLSLAISVELYLDTLLVLLPVILIVPLLSNCFRSPSHSSHPRDKVSSIGNWAVGINTELAIFVSSFHYRHSIPICRQAHLFLSLLVPPEDWHWPCPVNSCAPQTCPSSPQLALKAI